MAIEIVDLPIKIVIFHSYVTLPEGSGYESVGFALPHEILSFDLLQPHLQAVVKRVSLCRVAVDWPAEGQAA
jgi:hypothetical protein